MPQNIERVAIAVVEHEGRFLVGTRQPGQALAGHAEFPGGRCLEGEGAADCAVRECREETGLSVAPLRLIDARRHVYPHATVDLEFWLCRPVWARDIGPVSAGYEWVPAQALQSLQFPEANRGVLEGLAAGWPPAS